MAARLGLRSRTTGILPVLGHGQDGHGTSGQAPAQRHEVSLYFAMLCRTPPGRQTSDGSRNRVRSRSYDPYFFAT